MTLACSSPGNLNGTVIFGKLADVYGRKPMMLAGIGIFLLGSILAGCVGSMMDVCIGLRGGSKLQSARGAFPQHWGNCRADFV